MFKRTYPKILFNLPLTDSNTQNPHLYFQKNKSTSAFDEPPGKFA